MPILNSFILQQLFGAGTLIVDVRLMNFNLRAIYENKDA